MAGQRLKWLNCPLPCSSNSFSVFFLHSHDDVDTFHPAGSSFNFLKGGWILFFNFGGWHNRESREEFPNFVAFIFCSSRRKRRSRKLKEHWTQCTKAAFDLVLLHVFQCNARKKSCKIDASWLRFCRLSDYCGRILAHKEWTVVDSRPKTKVLSLMNHGCEIWMTASRAEEILLLLQNARQKQIVVRVAGMH